MNPPIPFALPLGLPNRVVPVGGRCRNVPECIGRAHRIEVPNTLTLPVYRFTMRSVRCPRYWAIRTSLCPISTAKFPAVCRRTCGEHFPVQPVFAFSWTKCFSTVRRFSGCPHR